MTGYKIQAGVFGGDKLVPPELRTTPLPRKEDVVAALKDWMNNHPTEQNISQSLLLQVCLHVFLQWLLNFSNIPFQESVHQTCSLLVQSLA